MKLKIRKVEYSIDLIPGPEETWAVREELKDMSTLSEGEEEGEIVYTKTYSGEFLEMATKFSDLVNQYKGLGAIEIESDDEIYDKLYNPINGGWTAYQNPNWQPVNIYGNPITIISGPCTPWLTFSGANWATTTITTSASSYIVGSGQASGMSWDTSGSLNITGNFTIE